MTKKRTFRQKFNLLILRVFGWSIVGKPEDIAYWDSLKKAVAIEAPHTAIIDWLWGYLTIRAIGKKPCILINKKFFFFPLGVLLRLCGGVPVYKDGSSKNLYAQIIKKVKEADKILLVITPEGTRKKVKRWHKGFYVIAQQAEIPLLLSGLDFKKKQAVLGPKFDITGDFQKDIIEIGKFYEGITACHPEKFMLPIA